MYTRRAAWDRERVVQELRSMYKYISRSNVYSVFEDGSRRQYGDGEIHPSESEDAYPYPT